MGENDQENLMGFLTHPLREKLSEKFGTLCSGRNVFVSVHLSPPAYGSSNGSDLIACPDYREAGLTQLLWLLRTGAGLL